MAKQVHWSNIPKGLRELKQWCVSNITHPDPAKRKAPRAPRGNAPLVSVTDPSQWGTFDEAADYAWGQGSDHWAIGFVLTAADPYCVIDLDVKDKSNAPDKPHLWSTQDEVDHFWNVAQEADSYVEKSLSGRSLHVFVQANIGEGCHAGNVEIYSQERYIIVTGDVLINKPIRQAQAMIEASVKNLRALQDDKSIKLVELEETDSDEEIWEKASNASNGEKFNKLARGEWEGDYKSQSEADLALLSMFCFYSQSNEQCRRLFRTTKLGKRAKATKNNRYLNETLSLIRGRQAQRAEQDAISAEMSRQLLDRLGIPQAAPHANGHTVGMAPAVHVEHPILTAPPEHRVPENQLEWPPGLVGELAKFVYANAPRPIREVAIVSALGLMAGICGKAYNLPQSGLNLYIVLIARSAIGKEAMHSGIAAILESLRSRNPAAMRFVDFSEFVSGPALVKGCLANPSFVNVSGEWGKRMKRMAADFADRDVAIASLRTVMTNLYQKSGATSIVGGMNYSKKEDSMMSVSGVAYSMIGETTPGTYYASLTESMMEDGFLSRFTMIEYSGDRPRMNKHPQLALDPAIADYLSIICSHALPRAGGQLKPVMVEKTEEAQAIIDEYEIICDDKINATGEESQRQMWNRASLKVQRIAALLSIGDNYLHPVMNEHHVLWAKDVVERDIKLMQRKLISGDIGITDESRERKLMAVMAEYFTSAIGDSYEIPPAMKKDGIVPRKFLQIRISRVNAFMASPRGATAAMDVAMKSLADNGYVREVDKDLLLRKYGFAGKAYQVIDLPKYLIQ